MKKIIAVLLIAGIFAAVQSCHKNESVGPQFKLQVENTPSAKVADDAKASGVYKGTLVGSSGSFKLVIVADEIIGYLTVDDAQYILTTDSIKASDLSGAIVNALFTDAAGKVKLWFSVNADGGDPKVTAIIEGHPDVQIVVMKETSDQAIRVFEGFLYTTDTSFLVQTKAAFNVVLGEDTISRVVYKVVEEYPVVQGAQHDRPADWQGDTYYHVLNFNDNYLYLYQLDTINRQPSGAYELWPRFVLEGLEAKYTENLISGKVLRKVNQGHELWDSVRLVRKL